MRTVLIDTSVWIDHFRRSDPQLVDLLKNDQVLTHPFVIGELACGEFKGRTDVLKLIQMIPVSIGASHQDVMYLVDRHKLNGTGIGWVDAHLLASAMLTKSLLWTNDKALAKASARLKVGLSHA